MLNGSTVSGKPGQGERNANEMDEAGHGYITVSRHPQYLIMHSSHCSDALDAHRLQGFYVVSRHDGGQGRRNLFGPFCSAAVAEKIITSAHYFSGHLGENALRVSALQAAIAGDEERAQSNLSGWRHVL